MIEKMQIPTYLIPDKHPGLEEDLFICDVVDATLKDIMAQMEFPFYTLSKKPDINIRRFEHNGNTLEITPSVKGLATIYDKDILIYAVSQIIAKLNRGEKIEKRVRLNTHELLQFTNRGTSGKDYKAVCEAITRLGGVQISTNIKTGDEEQYSVFGLIESSTVRRKFGREGRLLWADITLSDWVFNAIRANEVLTLSRDYFRLRKPIERRIYELARKHCGKQNAWKVSLELLHKKSGSQSSLKLFRQKIKSIVEQNHLPDYFIRYYKEKDLVTFINRNITNNPETQETAKNIDNPDIKSFSPLDYEKARSAIPGVDIYALEEVWRTWCKTKTEAIRDPLGAFIGFCKKFKGN